MLRSGLQFKLFGSGPILSAGVEAGAFVNPADRDGVPTIQAFCVPIVYRRPRSRASLLPRHLRRHHHHRRRQAEIARLRAAAHRRSRRDAARLAATARRPRRHGGDDRGPALLPARVPDEPAEAAHRPHLHRLRPTRSERRGARRALPAASSRPTFHPSGTCRMGPNGDPLAVLDPQSARARRRAAAGLRPLGDARHQRRQHQCAGDDAGQPAAQFCLEA